MVLVAALLFMAVKPAPAEALEPTVVLAIVGVAVAVVILIGYLVIANVDEARRAEAAPTMAVVVAYAPSAADDIARDSAP